MGAPGAEIIIENAARPVAILHAAEPVRRTISEYIALLPEDSTATIDADFSKDLAHAVESHHAPLIEVELALDSGGAGT